jgi:tRNA A-37 threonylcarbamoyl transferase component Bud32
MIGSVVGNYKIIEKIGEGGMGAVFKGVDLMLEREVAIKMLRPELARQPQVVERFRTEAVTLAKLNHSNVATLHSFFRQGDDFFMVMEFVRGHTLDEIIRAQGAMHCERAIEMFCMALEGIDHAHKMGIVHRDIKPANMMLTDNGSIKVMDFGIARVLGSNRLTKAGHLIGTVEYMSPEQVRGEETDVRSDIYSLGILLYEMLTGRVPFNSASEYELMRCQIEVAPTPPRVHAPHIPLLVEQAIMRSLAKKREARYQSASEFRSMLMRRNTGAVTTPLNAPGTGAAGYAAPVTQADRALQMGVTSGEGLKPTRLGSDQGLATQRVDELKETRLGQVDSGADARVAAISSSQAAVSRPQQSSFFSKLNWKHYAAVGVVFIAIIAGTIAFAVSGRKVAVEPPTAPPPSSESSNVPPQEPASSAQPAQPNKPTGGPAGVSPQPQPVTGAAPSGTPGGRAKPGIPKNAEPSQEPTPAPVVAQPAPQTQPPPKEEKVAVSTPEAEKKEPEKKPEEKKRGLFGKIKDAFTGSDKNKNKDPKKP